MAPTKKTLADFPDHVADGQLRHELHAKRAALESQLTEAERLREQLTVERNPARARVIAEAAALIGKSDEAVPWQTTAQLAEEAGRWRRELAVVNEAIEQLDRRIQQRRDRLAREIGPAYASEYNAGVVALIRALIQAARLDAKNGEIRDACEAALEGSPLGWCRPMGITAVGSLRDPNSGIRLLLREAVEFELVSPAWVAKEAPEIADQERREAAAAAADRKRREEAAKRDLAAEEARRRAAEAKRAQQEKREHPAGWIRGWAGDPRPAA